jgi:3,4-dehydroadipyl-CoA semialdehyde dehydrogenase
LRQAVESLLAGRWVAGAGAGSALHDAFSAETVASASSQGFSLGEALAYIRTVGGVALRTMTFAERGAVLKRLAALIHGSRDDLIEIARVNSGNTRSDAKFDIDGASGTLSYYAALGARLGARAGCSMATPNRYCVPTAL